MGGIETHTSWQYVISFVSAYVSAGIHSMIGAVSWSAIKLWLYCTATVLLTLLLSQTRVALVFGEHA